MHGVNLGLRASVYLHAGGFPPTPNHEDLRLIQRVRRTPGVIIEQTQQLIVSTSGRLEGRCRYGFAATLTALNATAGSCEEPPLFLEPVPRVGVQGIIPPPNMGALVSDLENQAEKDVEQDPQLKQDAAKEAEKEGQDIEQDLKKDL